MKISIIFEYSPGEDWEESIDEVQFWDVTDMEAMKEISTSVFKNAPNMLIICEKIFAYWDTEAEENIPVGLKSELEDAINQAKGIK